MLYASGRIFECAALALQANSRRWPAEEREGLPGELPPTRVVTLFKQMGYLSCYETLEVQALLERDGAKVVPKLIACITGLIAAVCNACLAPSDAHAQKLKNMTAATEELCASVRPISADRLLRTSMPLGVSKIMLSFFDRKTQRDDSPEEGGAPAAAPAPAAPVAPAKRAPAKPRVAKVATKAAADPADGAAAAAAPAARKPAVRKTAAAKAAAIEPIASPLKAPAAVPAAPLKKPATPRSPPKPPAATVGLSLEDMNSLLGELKM